MGLGNVGTGKPQYFPFLVAPIQPFAQFTQVASTLGRRAGMVATCLRHGGSRAGRKPRRLGAALPCHS